MALMCLRIRTNPHEHSVLADAISTDISRTCRIIIHVYTLVNVYVDCWYLRVLSVLHRQEVVDIVANTVKKSMPYA